MRAAHYIKRNAGLEMPSEVIWFDTETRPEWIGLEECVHRLWFGWACYRRRTRRGAWTSPDWYRFETRAEFWAWVETKARARAKLYLFCHNTSFDLPVLDAFGELPRLGWEMKRAIIDAPPTIVHFRRGSTTLCLLDTLNLWRMSLDDLATKIGSQKLPMPGQEASRAEWDRYARQDVTVIHDALMGWWSWLTANDLGGFAPTLASQAYRTYRHRFMPAKILAHASEPALAIARASYVGGRCEAFHIGAVDGPVTVVDLTANYPAVMRGRRYPHKLLGFDERHAERTLARCLMSHECIATVDLVTDMPAYPSILGEKLCFPVGRFSATLASPELRAAVQAGHVTGCSRIAVFHGAEIFTGFVDWFWAQRRRALEEGNEPLAWNFKIMMNSLYGKFGQRGYVWDEEARIPDLSARCWTYRDTVTGETLSYRQLCGLVQVRSTEGESRDSVPEIAATVTSAARVLLWTLMQKAGLENIYYCDTDSLHVTAEGASRLADEIDPAGLGMLKIEGVFDSAEYCGAKDYRLGAAWKIKGIRKSAAQVTPSIFRQQQWTSLKGLVRAGQLSSPATSMVEKRLSRRYTKGSIGPGGRVSPLVMGVDDPPEGGRDPE